MIVAVVFANADEETVNVQASTVLESVPSSYEVTIERAGHFYSFYQN